MARKVVNRKALREEAEAAEKASRFLQLCDAFDLPILSLTDTPGFMVGPDSETEAAVRRMSSLFVSFASVTVPVVAIVLRKGYGLGAQAMAGAYVEPAEGSGRRPHPTRRGLEASR